ncbi:Piso0_003461 [Millerozyma farinosa CBS 7064]|uniref:Piso0_003461 protein n=1 Tax=Pichia sorbitophila (strain ATCC MYA-4447 / BCRC 22081 / CBS 7064 / NBRC 10061 / NRRL Y-12695) TaxID=559304 RepID=G8YJ50_PICSO|nr:Piso0_003461 [Millerozyma farinosa CBS 7064]CCE81110.1 Piso0_003461 [Millerozyma farinosa CBS 7064]
MQGSQGQKLVNRRCRSSSVALLLWLRPRQITAAALPDSPPTLSRACDLETGLPSLYSENGPQARNPIGIPPQI